jgi:antagonist of KipI
VTPVFEVLQPGVLSTIQDLGRTGWQRLGVGTAGAMDRFALQVANLLVGNPRGTAALEIGMGGLRLRCLEDWVVSVCGAEMGAGIPLWKSIRVRKGTELFFKSALRGVWAYLAPAGGIDAESVLGSRSTSLRENLGPRAAAKGDVLRAGPPRPSTRDGRLFLPSAVPEYPDESIVRVVLGPQEDRFTEEAVQTFLSRSYEVTPRSNRMGYQLSGPPLRHKETADILSEAVATGSVQVPADGQPIVLMADRQTTGGYTKIATVISADLPAMAQVRPGLKVAFRSVSVEEAQDSAGDVERMLSTLQTGCGV